MIRRTFRRVEGIERVDGGERNRFPQRSYYNYQGNNNSNTTHHKQKRALLFFAIWLCLLVGMLCLFGWIISILQLSPMSISKATDIQTTHSQPLLNKDDYNKDPSSFWYHTTDHQNFTAAHDNKVIYVGMYGLGHRLSKMAGAYHLSQKLAQSSTSARSVFHKNYSWPVTHLEVLWGDCGTSNSNNTPGNNQMDVFEHLFGNYRIALGRKGNGSLISSEQSPPALYQQGKSLVIRNDVAGYYAGQIYKNARIPLSSKVLTAWEDKMESDLVLFRNLVRAFDNNHSRKLVHPFQQQHQWNNHFVMGLHIRAGNGEQEHFEQAQRRIGDQATFYKNLVQTVSTFWKEEQRMLETPKAPLIFLATDTASVLETMTHLFQKHQIPVISVPQPRVAENKGVSYAAWTEGAKCQQGWLYSMVDMSLLAKSQVVIAARRSTFTQILPRSLLLDDTTKAPSDSKRHRFCEVSNSGLSMTCFAHRDAWIFRGQISSPTAHAYHIFGEEAREASPENSSQKVMVHFPDPAFFGNTGDIAVEDPDLKWLSDSQQFWRLSQTQDLRMLYGSGKIAKKYRRPQKGIKKEVQSNWTFASH